MIFHDRVKETSTTTGTGDFTLAGAVSAFETFNANYGTQVWFPYAIVGQTGTEWEVGVGYLSASSTLARSKVTASSNSNAAVNFSAGTKDVFVPINGTVATNMGVSGKALAQAKKKMFAQSVYN